MIIVSLDVAKKMAATVQKSLPKNSPKEILNGILVQGDSGTITLTAHNGLSGFRVKGSGQVAQCSFVVAHGERFLNFIKVADGEKISLQPAQNHVVITVGKAKIQLPILDATLYPTLPTMESPTLFPNLLYAVAKVYPFSKNVRDLPYEGVHIAVNQGTCIVEATSGHQAARITSTVMREDCNWVLSAEEAKDLCSIFSEDVFVQEKDGHLLVSDGVDVMWATRLLPDDRYPDLFPILYGYASQGTFETMRSALYGAAKRALVVVGDRDNQAAKLTFTPASIRIDGKSPYGDVSESVEARYSGETKVMGFNLSFLQHILSKWTSENVTADIIAVRTHAHGILLQNETERYLLLQVLLSA